MSWGTLSSMCDIGWCKGEGGLELWPTVSAKELDREGGVNIGDAEVWLSAVCTPLE